MDRHHRRRLPARFVLSGAIALALAAPAVAQNVVVTSGDASHVMVSRATLLPISDESIRSLISEHLPNVLQPGAEENYIVLVVDANDQYVTSKATKAITGSAGQNIVTFKSSTDGDSAAAGAVLIRTSALGEAWSAMAGAATGAISTFVVHGGDSTSLDSAHGVMGTDVRLSDVSSIGLKRFAAGELAAGQLIVSVIKLK